MDVKALRKRFGKLQENGRYIAGDRWRAAVEKLLPPEPTPEQWVEAAEKVTVKCDVCPDGICRWGACVDGAMQFSAPCIRCQGKGKQTAEDMGRNRFYDNHRRIA